MIEYELWLIKVKRFVVSFSLCDGIEWRLKNDVMVRIVF